MAPCKPSWHLLDLNPRFLHTGIVTAILRRKFFNQTSLEPRGQKAHSIPAPTSARLCHEGTMPTTPQGVLKLPGHCRTQPGLGHCPCLCQGHLLALPGITKIPSSHYTSHSDIRGLGKDGFNGSTIPTLSSASRGNSARTQETSKDKVTPVLLPRVLLMVTPGSRTAQTQPRPQKPQHHQVHTAMCSVQTWHSSTTHSSRHQDLL